WWRPSRPRCSAPRASPWPARSRCGSDGLGRHQAPDALDEGGLHGLVEDDAVDLVHEQPVEEGLLVLDDLAHALLDRPLRDEVEDLDALTLSHPVNAADPLLEGRRVPRDLEVDDDGR